MANNIWLGTKIDNKNELVKRSKLQNIWSVPKRVFFFFLVYLTFFSYFLSYINKILMLETSNFISTIKIINDKQYPIRNKIR